MVNSHGIREWLPLSTYPLRISRLLKIENYFLIWPHLPQKIPLKFFQAIPSKIKKPPRSH